MRLRRIFIFSCFFEPCTVRFFVIFPLTWGGQKLSIYFARLLAPPPPTLTPRGFAHSGSLPPPPLRYALAGSRYHLPGGGGGFALGLRPPLALRLRRGSLAPPLTAHGILGDGSRPPRPLHGARRARGAMRLRAQVKRKHINHTMPHWPTPLGRLALSKSTATDTSGYIRIAVATYQSRYPIALQSISHTISQSRLNYRVVSLAIRILSAVLRDWVPLRGLRADERAVISSASAYNMVISRLP